MRIFIKTEQFTQETLSLPPEQRHHYLAAHQSWVNALRASGENLSSGYLIDQAQKPGGGGLLILQASSFEDAKRLVEQDPMIKNKLVHWQLQEWIPITDNTSLLNHLG